MTSLRIPVDVGEGPAIVLLHGFGMKPETYGRTADLLAHDARVVIPDLFAIRGHWSYDRVFRMFVDTVDDLGLKRFSMLGHSFGGGIELGFAARYPRRVVELVFSDTLAVSREFALADEALRHPLRLLWLATPEASAAFVANSLGHPRQLAGAGWWAFRAGRSTDASTCREGGIPAHVLWANRDSVLSRSDGMRFAEELGATFTVARPDDGRPIDHDWMFEEPHLFVEHLRGLDLIALSHGARTSQRQDADSSLQSGGAAEQSL